MAQSAPYFHRFCIHLPLLYNDKKPIEIEKIDSMLNTIKDRFGGYTKSPHLGYPTYEGVWYVGPDEKIYYDKLFIMYIDAPDDGKAIKFFREFKKETAELLEQQEIYIIYWPITKV